MTSLSEILREKIGNAIDNNVDLLTENSRTEFFTNFCNDADNKKAGFEFAKHRSLFLVQFKKTLKEKGKDPVLYGMSRGDNKSFPKKNIDMDSTITPKPKEVSSRNPKEGDKQLTEKTDSSVPPEDKEEQIEITLDHAKITTKFMFNLARAKFKDWEPLSEDEVNALGAAWLPILKKYLAQNWGMWGLCLMTTGGIVATRIAAGKDKEKPKDERPKGKTQTQKEGEELAKAARGQTGEDDRPDWQKKLGVGDQ